MTDALSLDMTPLPETITLDLSALYNRPLNINMNPRLTREQHLERAAKVIKRGIRPASELIGGWAGKKLIIVGGGPSLKDGYHDLALSISSQRGNVCVMALNQTHDWLIKGERDPLRPKKWLRHPIVPEFALMLDPKPWCADYMTPHAKPLYLFGTPLDDVVWEKFRLHTFARTYWWYPIYDKGGSDLEELTLRNKLSDFVFTAGGSTVGLRALNIAMMLGFNSVELWGFDSVYPPSDTKRLHAYDKPHTQHARRAFTIASKSDGARFSAVSNDAMAAQIKEFGATVHEIEGLIPGETRQQAELGCIWGAFKDGIRQVNQAYRLTIQVAGDGAIPWMAWKDGGPDKIISHTHPKRMAAKYGQSRHWDYSQARESLEVAA